MARIDTLDQLKTLYGEPRERTANKEIEELDQHSRRILSLSPFCLIGTSDGRGNADVTPRGDKPGFVEVYDSRTLLLPDRPGNNRLDSLRNIVENSAVGMLFLVPGVGETMRVNGQGEIRDDEDLLDRCAVNGKRPTTVLLIHIEAIYIHCPKALIRSKLWDPSAQIDRAALPTLGQMLRDHSGMVVEGETDENLVDRLNKSLW